MLILWRSSSLLEFHLMFTSALVQNDGFSWDWNIFPMKGTHATVGNKYIILKIIKDCFATRRTTGGSFVLESLDLGIRFIEVLEELCFSRGCTDVQFCSLSKMWEYALKVFQWFLTYELFGRWETDNAVLYYAFVMSDGSRRNEAVHTCDIICVPSVWPSFERVLQEGDTRY